MCHLKAVGACLLLGLCVELQAAKKDFKGLFGSYRREKFIENEARSTNFGMDLLLSTLVPISPVIKSQETRGGEIANLQFATFFNLEAAFFFTLNYHWEIVTSVGWYNYDTRKENKRTDPALPVFHLFEMEAYPIIAGIKYRLTTDDIVPYVGAGVGFSYVRRKGFYDNGAQFDQEFSNVVTGQILAGLEFFFHPQVGIRLEAAAYYFRLNPRSFDTGGVLENHPILLYQANPWLVRYASGIFLLF